MIRFSGRNLLSCFLLYTRCRWGDLALLLLCYWIDYYSLKYRPFSGKTRTTIWHTIRAYPGGSNRMFVCFVVLSFQNKMENSSIWHTFKALPACERLEHGTEEKLSRLNFRWQWSWSGKIHSFVDNKYVKVLEKAAQIDSIWFQMGEQMAANRKDEENIQNNFSIVLFWVYFPWVKRSRWHMWHVPLVWCGLRSVGQSVTIFEFKLCLKPTVTSHSRTHSARTDKFCTSTEEKTASINGLYIR